MRFAILMCCAFTVLPAQDIKLPSNLDKLAAKAAEVVDVTLDTQTLQLAARFLSDKDADEARVKKLVSGLRGIYVKSFEFDKEGEYDPAEVEAIRAQLRTPGWTRIVGVFSRRDKDNAEVYLKNDNGQVGGLTIIAAEPKELTIVNIVGTINPEDIRELSGHLGIPKLDEKHGDKKRDKKED